jgi:hypothetical protein
MLSGIARIRNIRMHAAEPECEQVPINSGAIFGLSNIFRFSHLKYVVYIVTVLTMLGMHGISFPQNSNSKVAAETLEMFNFEEVNATNPNQDNTAEMELGNKTFARAKQAAVPDRARNGW